MALLLAADRPFAQTISRLAYSNPFLPERIEREREALGRDYTDVDLVWNKRADLLGDHPNIHRIIERLEALIARLRTRLGQGVAAGEEELILYEEMVNFLLYHRYREPFSEFILGAMARKSGGGARVPFYRDYLRDAEALLGFPGYPRKPYFEFNHLFASAFQVRRAFHGIFDSIIGESMPMARLRARVWESIFTHDRRRYWRALYDRTADVTCLIIGPSGTGKELVARAIALACYIPFDPKAEAFTEDFTAAFHPLNISALSPTLIESELFGHRRGAFTGALQDRMGWLEICGQRGTVFLDEIGELDEAIQVKLLRVLQSRTFQRIGDTQDRTFKGKIIAATNRDLAERIGRKLFREDFYYRLCADIITTPTLAEQMQSSPTALPTLIRFLTLRLVGEAEAEPLALEVEEWIGRNLPRDYAWPGNVRELEQCIRNIMMHRDYQPLRVGKRGYHEDLANALGAGALTAEEVLRRYCTLVYARTRNYRETARRLGLDQRTVRSKVIPELLAELTGGEPGVELSANNNDECA